MDYPRPRRESGAVAPVRRRPATKQLLADLTGLREPLDGILGRIDRLLAGPLPEETRGSADAIRSDARDLLTRLGEIADLAELDQGTLEIQAVPYSPAATVRDELARLRPRVEREGLELTYRPAGPLPPRVIGDPSRLRQVLAELIGYALSRTPRGGIVVRTRQDDGRLLLDVEDTGLGAERERLERELAGERSRRGPALARELVELMGGRLRAFGRPGLGTSFRVELPLDPEPADAGLVERADLGDARVLLLGEDDGLLEETLEGSGAHVLASRSSTVALRHLRSALEADRPFDVVLACPPFDGPDALTFGALVKGDPALRPTELVLLAASGRPGDAARLEDHGWGGYLARPVDAATLRAALEVVLGSRSGAPSEVFVTRHLLAESGLGDPAPGEEAALAAELLPPAEE